MSNRTFATALASALADLGVEHACISPGSRNTPLIAGFATEPRVRKWPLLDERSGGFFALGIAKATGKPVVLACTSGTAAVEYHAAVVEASQSDIPLLAAYLIFVGFVFTLANLVVDAIYVLIDPRIRHGAR